MRLGVAQVQRVDHQPDIRRILSRLPHVWDFDQFEAGLVHRGLESLVALPVTVSLLDDDAALEQQPFEHRLDVELVVLCIANAERDVLEVTIERHDGGFGRDGHDFLLSTDCGVTLGCDESTTLRRTKRRRAIRGTVAKSTFGRNAKAPEGARPMLVMVNKCRQEARKSPRRRSRTSAWKPAIEATPECKRSAATIVKTGEKFPRSRAARPMAGRIVRTRHGETARRKRTQGAAAPCGCCVNPRLSVDYARRLAKAAEPASAASSSASEPGSGVCCGIWVPLRIGSTSDVANGFPQ